MNPTKTPLSIALAIATLLTFLASFAGLVWSFFIPHLGMGITCTALTILFAFFVRNDYYRFFQTK